MAPITNVTATSFCESAQLFWPDSVEDGGCAVPALNYSAENMKKWSISTKGNRQKIETALNHIHLYDYVNDCSEVDLPRLEAAARRMAEAWRLRVTKLYPDKKFDVNVASEPNEYGPSVSVIFY